MAKKITKKKTTKKVKKGLGLKVIKKELKKGKTKIGKYPLNHVSRDADNDYSKLSVEDGSITVMPMVTMNTLRFTGVVTSENPSREKPKTDGLNKTHLDVASSYLVTIQFLEIKFNDKKSEAFNSPIKIQGEDGPITKWYRKPSFNRKRVQIKCQCADFRHRFENQLKNQGALFSQPRKYTRKTPAWTIGLYQAWLDDPANNPYPYPFANADNKIGFCKHVSSFYTHLKTKGFVTEN